jgi:flavin reductase (DIM6/NTAB) family NADH-FMN oxidoreductase RutF
MMKMSDSLFKTISADQLTAQPFKLLGVGGYLLTAGPIADHNSMTCGWGTLGFLWGRNVVNVYVRPHRYTYEFMERHEFFSLSLLPPEYKSAINLFGTVSGRDRDRCKEAGLTLAEKNGTAYYLQADTVIFARKIYCQDMYPSRFLDESILKLYAKKDYPRIYTGEVLQIIKKI